MWFRFGTGRGVRCRDAASHRDVLEVRPAGPGFVTLAAASGAWPPITLSALQVGQLRAALRDELVRSCVDERQDVDVDGHQDVAAALQPGQ